MRLKFNLWLEQRAPWVYHVTLYRNLPGLSEQGLVPQGAYSIWEKEHWTQGKNFFSSDLANSRFWVHTIQQMIDHEYESGGWQEHNFVEDGAIPVICRFPFNNRGRWSRDLASEKGAGDWYTRKSIQPQGIQWWDGRRWKSVDDLQFDQNLFVYPDRDWFDRVDHEDEDIPEHLQFYWRFRDPYPFPTGA